VAEQLTSLLAMGTILLAAYGLGRPIVRGLRASGMDDLTTVAWSFVVGLIVAGLGLASLGLTGALYRPLVVVASLVAGAWGAVEFVRGYLQRLARAANTAGGWNDDEPPAWATPSPWLRRGMLALAVVACLGALVGALAPPTAGVALSHHLELPKRFLTDHAMSDPPYSDNATYPLLVEMWYLWALALDSAVAAQLVHWMLGVLLATAAVVLARPILGRDWAWIVGAVVLLTPGINHQMTAPLDDLGLAVMTTFALAAWWRATVGQEGRLWFVLAGLAAGGALGTKYAALVFALAMAATWAWSLARYPERRRLLLEGAAVVAVVAIGVGGLWYVRAAWLRGNPVYPFFSEIGSVTDPDARTLKTLPESRPPLRRDPLGLAAAPWQITMHPECFGGREHQLGALFLAVLPGLAFARRLRGLGTLLAVATVYGVMWHLLRQNVRLLFPVVPPLSVAVVWVWVEMHRFPRIPRRVATAVLAVLVVAFVLVAANRTRDRLAVAVGLEDRESYLSRCEPSFASAIVANLIVGRDGHILSQDDRLFYFNARATRESLYRRATGYDRDVTKPSDLGRVLRQAGFTHLLLVENLSPVGAQFDPTLRRLADADGSLRPISHNLAKDADGATRHYRLLALP
jgi:hypothetical protein